ncbi:MAG: hypothetical protein J6S86_04745 [Alphaproteobacteria bacterium]|nr:hypothetical protein [Alphaproteobacteria bacterium]
MRVIILNMIVLGAMSSLVENDVFARDVSPTSFADEIKLIQSGNLVGKEDFSDSFDQLFSLNNSEEDSESLNNSDSKNKKDNNTSSNGKKSKKHKKKHKKNKNNASYETDNFAPYNKQPTYSMENDLKENINLNSLDGLSDSKSSNESFSKSEKNSEGNEKYNNNLKQNYDSESQTEQDFYPQTEDNLSQSESGTESGLPSTQPTPNGNTNILTQSLDQAGSASVSTPPPAMTGNTNVPPATTGNNMPPAPPPSAMTENVNIPPAPPPSAMAGNVNIPPAPPPPPLPQANVPPLPGSPVSTEVNVSDLVRDLRDKLNDLLVSDGVIQMANIVNFYLQGNKEVISEGIGVSGGAASLLINRLNKELEVLEKKFASDSIIKEFRDLLESLRSPLQKLNKQSYYAIDSDRGKFFKDISQEIKRIAASYFSKFMESGENLKSIPNLIASLKEADIIMERAVVLSNSFSNLVDLSEMPRIEEFTEGATLDAIEIIRLKRFFAAKLKEANSASSNSTAEGNASTSSKQVDLKPLSGSITLPTGNSVTEKVVVEKALHCIEETLSGNDQLSVLVDIRDILNNSYTAIVSKEEGNTPLNVIRRLSDRIADVGTLVGEAGKIEKTKTEKGEDKEVERNNNYSQFGKMFTGSDDAYGTALIPSINKWISSEKFTEFNVNEIAAAFRGKQLTKDKNVIEEYLRLLTEDKALCGKSFSNSIIDKMNSNAKFKSSVYAFAAIQSKQKTESKMEDHQFLFEIMAGDGKTKLGTSSDPNRDKNMISFSALKKNCEKYIEGMASIDKERVASIDKDIIAIPDILKKAERSFSTKIDNKGFAEYVNSILKEYFVFDNFVTSSDRITLGVVNAKKGLLSEKDIPNVVFALAQNCGLAVKQPALPLFSTSKDTDNIWVFKMSQDLLATTSKTINAILDAHAKVFSGKEEIKGTEVEGIIEKLDNLRKSIENAIYQDEVLENVIQGLNISVSKAKADAEAEEKKPAEKIDKKKLDKIKKQMKNLSELTDDLPNPYAQNNQSKIQTIKSVVKEVISLVETVSDIKDSDIKDKAKLSQKPNRRDARFIR